MVEASHYFLAGGGGTPWRWTPPQDDRYANIWLKENSWERLWKGLYQPWVSSAPLLCSKKLNRQWTQTMLMANLSWLSLSRMWKNKIKRMNDDKKPKATNIGLVFGDGVWLCIALPSLTGVFMISACLIPFIKSYCHLRKERRDANASVYNVYWVIFLPTPPIFLYYGIYFSSQYPPPSIILMGEKKLEKNLPTLCV